MTNSTSTPAISASVERAPASNRWGARLRAQIVRDGRSGLRAGGGWLHSLFFFAVFCGSAVFAIGPERAPLAAAAPALIWLAGALALQLSSATLFTDDLADGALRAIAAEAPSLAPYVAGKAMVLALLAAAPIALSSPLFGVFFALAPAGAAGVGVIFALSAPALVLASVAAAALSTGARGAGLLGAGLAAPLTVPILIFGVGACERYLVAGALVSPELQLLGAVTLLYAVALPPFAISALRIALE